MNFFQAGPLSIYRDALAELSRNFSDRYDVVALVHRKELFDIPNIQLIEYPEIRSSWLRRIKFEYYDLRKISGELNAFLWLSLHDMSPRVTAKIQAVYCHNPTPFAKLKKSDVLYNWRYSLFVLLYRYLYRINIHRNNFVIVQQDWMRNRFREMYGVENVVVAHPRTEEASASGSERSTVLSSGGDFVFFYPAFPRTFKNIEILLQAAELLKRDSIEIWLTLSGEESRYARSLSGRARSLPNIKLLGRLTREQVSERYDAADCLIFPSRLETWGLPISEFKRTGKPMLLADLPYAHETLGTYGCAHFFDPNDPGKLAQLMRAVAQGNLPKTPTTAAAIAAPFAADWHELFNILLKIDPSARPKH